MKNRSSKLLMAQRTSAASDSHHAKPINKMFDTSKVDSTSVWHQWSMEVRRNHLTFRRQWADGWRRLAAKPLSTLLLILMLAAVLFLPLAFYVVFQNITTWQQGFDTQPTASLFLRDDAQSASILADRLRKRTGVLEVRIIDKNAGLEQLRQASGFSAEWLNAVDSNPLPDVILLTLNTSVIEDLQQFREQLAALPDVEHVTLDVLWLQRLSWLITLLQRIAVVLTAALALVVVLTIANTIRLTVENARAEIQVGWLVGANQGFIRRPFLFMGALYGFFGAIAALLLLAVVAWWLHEPAQSLLASYTPTVSSWSTIAEIGLIMLLVSVLLGWLGAGLAVRGVLAKLLPEAS